MNDQSGQYTLEFEELPNHLRVTVRSDVWTPEIALDYNRRVAEKVSELDPERILIFRDVSVTLHSGAVFPLMSEFVEGVGARKVAVVNPFPSLREDLKFAIRIATNRKAKYMLFENIPEAEAWLMA